MIGNDSYSASYYNAVGSRTAGQLPVYQGKKAAEDAAAADFGRTLNGGAPSPAVATAPTPANSAPSADNSFLGFVKGILDVINPLQHIPVIGAIYRHITGDEISPMARLAGDALYGGPIGAALAVADISYQKVTGKDAGETMIAALTGGKNKNPAEESTMMAQNLNDGISTAAGGVRLADIIWSDTQSVSASNSGLPLTPALHAPAGANGKDPAPHSTPDPAPVLQMEGNVPTLQALTASKVDSTSALHPQEAPAAASRTDVPPELIAAKMMEALDKYQQMKQVGMTSTISGLY